MKNIFGTQETIYLYDKNKVLRYNYFGSIGYQSLYTYNSSGNELAYNNSKGCWYRYTRDSEGNILTYENSDGLRVGFDIPEYIMEELTKIIGKEFKVKK
jgi:YD repeat-containing protein